MEQRIEIKKTATSAEYFVYIDRDPNGRPDFWVDPQYGTIIADDETAVAPDGLIELVRKFIRSPVEKKDRDIDAEIKNEIEYDKHHASVKNAMTLNGETY